MSQTELAYTIAHEGKCVLMRICVLRLQVARKLVIIEGDLERTEERAELAEA